MKLKQITYYNYIDFIIEWMFNIMQSVLFSSFCDYSMRSVIMLNISKKNYFSVNMCQTKFNR